MFHQPTSSSHIQKTLTRTAARIAVLSLLAAFLFLGGLAYANLDSGRAIPTGQESTIPIGVETQMPSLFPTKPVSADLDALETQRTPTKPVRYVPAEEGARAIPMTVDALQIASIATHLAPTDSQFVPTAYGVPTIPYFVDAK
jgi:hypothetical protein